MKAVSDVVGEYSGRPRVALEYAVRTKRIVDSAKQSGFGQESWAPLAELLALDEFERIGNFKEVMDWPQYVEFLTNWAVSAEWDGLFKRVSEVDGVVFLELEERSRMGDFESVVNSVSVYEFTADDKVRHIDVYLQMALPGMDMLTSFEGVEISE
ncbi:hypothetical protein [Mycolicibacterium lutetiense]|jgi:hypothetical protein|uniref:SnoaL-like domain-containing protein n=1 Tax=Mycolicibacterium lutetiense TaxID=1641992 RepID=A0ABS4ZV54_9MYCO|nr:hypothetical protein [Mycolicibacterium lutetiense]MBP2452469.1 hypothetical protein [Mycolicibacterium lutetiense]